MVMAKKIVFEIRADSDSTLSLIHISFGKVVKPGEGRIRKNGGCIGSGQYRMVWRRRDESKCHLRINSVCSKH